MNNKSRCIYYISRKQVVKCVTQVVMVAKTIGVYFKGYYELLCVGIETRHADDDDDDDNVFNEN